VTNQIGSENVSRETKEYLSEYVNLISKWNPHINLVSKKSLEDIWPRHIWDSWQINELAPKSAKNWLDLGSGGGLPGVLVAIYAKANQLDRQVCLMESDRRKGQFLRTVIRELDLNAVVITERIEVAAVHNADVISARALASLNQLLGFAYRHLAKDGLVLVHKGGQYQNEIESARQNWHFDSIAHPSITEPTAAILKIRSISYAK